MKSSSILVVLLLNTIFLLECSSSSRDRKAPEETLQTTGSLSSAADFDHLLINQRIPIFYKQTTNGTTVDSNYFKNKITLINFMYIGCVPCMEEAPLLKEVYQSVHSTNFQMLCIAPQTSEQMKKLQPYVIPYSIIAECSKLDVLGQNTDSECRAISKKFLVSGYPSVLLVDTKGIIRYRHMGFSKQHPPDLKAEIKSLLEQPKI